MKVLWLIRDLSLAFASIDMETEIKSRQGVPRRALLISFSFSRLCAETSLLLVLACFWNGGKHLDGRVEQPIK